MDSSALTCCTFFVSMSVTLLNQQNSQRSAVTNRRYFGLRPPHCLRVSIFWFPRNKISLLKSFCNAPVVFNFSIHLTIETTGGYLFRQFFHSFLHLWPIRAAIRISGNIFWALSYLHSNPLLTCPRAPASIHPSFSLFLPIFLTLSDYYHIQLFIMSATFVSLQRILGKCENHTLTLRTLRLSLR